MPVLTFSSPSPSDETSPPGERSEYCGHPTLREYPDGQPAGQVGQEIYGAGAAMVFATRAFHRIEGAPFVIFCDHFLRATTRLDANTLSVKIDGEDNYFADFVLLRDGRRQLPEAIVRMLNGKVIEPYWRSKDEACYKVPAYTGLVVSW